MTQLRVFATVVSAIVLMCLCALLAGNHAITKIERQVHRMHTMTEQHRNYEPAIQWRHDENVLRKVLRTRRLEQAVEIAGVISFALAAVAIGIRIENRKRI